jgi:hypothetical protein
VLAAFGKAFRLVVLPLSVSAIVGIYFSFSPGAGIRAIGFVVCTVWAIAIVSMTVKAAWQSRWRRCLGLIAILLVALPLSYVLAFWTGDYVHLAVMWPSYRSTIQAEPGSRITWDWQELEMLFGQVGRTLVYDPSDSEAHEKDIPFADDGSFTTHRHLIGHFYVVECNPWEPACGERPTRAKGNSLALLPRSGLVQYLFCDIAFLRQENRFLSGARMSEMGHKRCFRRRQSMSALPHSDQISASG